MKKSITELLTKIQTRIKCVDEMNIETKNDLRDLEEILDSEYSDDNGDEPPKINLFPPRF